MAKNTNFYGADSITVLEILQGNQKGINGFTV